MKFVEKRGKYFWPNKEMEKISLADKEIYKQGENAVKFWGKAAEDLFWFKHWKKTYEQKGVNFKWFLGSKINLCYNAVDRHLEERGNQAAIIFVPEPVNEKKQIITYSRLYEMVNSASALLLKNGIKKGDVVSIYLPLVPEIIIFMLACARIGAIHSVVFSAFSAEALRTRLKDGKDKLLISIDKYYRKGEAENLVKKANQATRGMKIKKIILKRAKIGKNLGCNKNIKVEAREMNSEDILYILYTSGTTGKPKGVIHETGGYAVQAYLTTKLDFNLNKGDIIWCTADIGWVTGHTYACYGPLLNGSTTLIYEGATNYPNPSRLFKIIEENKVNVFYTAPTAIRIFALEGDKYAKKFKLDSLRLLATVGEPIDEGAWYWYFDNIGKKRLAIIDTWWQTETGGTLINALPGIGPFIPTVAGKNFPGTKHEVVDDKGKIMKKGKEGLLVQIKPFAPGMLRGIWRNEKRYKKYFKYGLYFTGDNAVKHNDEFRILGRADDVIKVAGHRMSIAEIENVIDSHAFVSESAVVSRPDKIKGEAIVAFVKLKKKRKVSEKEIIERVSKKISPIAKPSEIYFVNDLPKTRSGKIMRRILKALLRQEKLGELSTLMNPECIKEIEQILKTKKT